MAEENKNLEIQKPKKKSRIFRIGLGLIIIGSIIIGIYLLNIVFNPKPNVDIDLNPALFVTRFLSSIIGSPFLCLGILLFLLSLFLQAKKISQKIIIIFLTIFVLLIPIQFVLLTFSHFSIFSRLAVISENESFCKIVILSSYKNECYRTMSELKQDSHLCEKIKGRSEERDFCYWKISKLREDISLCERVNESVYRGYCYYDLALIKKDSNICEKIEEYQSGTYSISISTPVRISDLCYEHLSLELGDHTLCEKIENLEIRSDCYNNVKHRMW